MFYQWYNPTMPSIVALDLETTGLDSKTDAIIEIGAIRFNDRRVEEEFQTLIRPPRGIPEFITNLTGISNQMVQNSPTIEEIIPELEDFVADLPILGHNVKFDVGFLREQGLFRYNETLDTYDMASVLLPGAGRYNLGALGQYLGIPFPAEHRALEDARVDARRRVPHVGRDRAVPGARQRARPAGHAVPPGPGPG